MRPTLFMLVCLVCSCISGAVFEAQAQEQTGPPAQPGTAPPPKEVTVKPAAKDNEISRRIESIMTATGWFEAPSVTVQNGIVFIDGRAKRQEQKTWVGALAERTQDVVAVVNRVSIDPAGLLDFSPALGELRVLLQQSIQALPLLGVALVVLMATWVIARLASRMVERVFSGRFPSPLLVTAASRLAMVFVLLAGLYLILRISGLVQLALTVVGGTGLIGIIVGFGFRDLAENYLASLLLSTRNPFRRGDYIEVAGFSGLVSNLNTRSTVLLTLEGNQVQIPNAAVFKSSTGSTAKPTRSSRSAQRSCELRRRPSSKTEFRCLARCGRSSSREASPPSAWLPELAAPRRLAANRLWRTEWAPRPPNPKGKKHRPKVISSPMTR